MCTLVLGREREQQWMGQGESAPPGREAVSFHSYDLRNELIYSFNKDLMSTYNVTFSSLGAGESLVKCRYAR